LITNKGELYLKSNYTMLKDKLKDQDELTDVRP